MGGDIPGGGGGTTGSDGTISSPPSGPEYEAKISLDSGAIWWHGRSRTMRAHHTSVPAAAAAAACC